MQLGGDHLAGGVDRLCYELGRVERVVDEHEQAALGVGAVLLSRGRRSWTRDPQVDHLEVHDRSLDAAVEDGEVGLVETPHRDTVAKHLDRNLHLEHRQALGEDLVGDLLRLGDGGCWG
ncbi:MAG TPA: hypothetical protein VMT85_22150 [Thermoanaerobaculia bacterium]|nr:hypothetical protein [Thermoanaerobaculia bacterium]